MEAILFIGIQATGKSSFFRSNFFNTHVRINKDMLRTNNREKRLLETCLEIGQPFVIDKTNVTRNERLTYIKTANDNGFKVIGYYFQSKIEDSIM